MPSKMPQQRPGNSPQSYCTPPEFLTAVKHRLGITEFAIDLAADEHNTAADRWWDESQNSLQQDWDWGTGFGWAWLNSPFSKLDPWVRRSYEQSRWREVPGGKRSVQIAQLVPAGVGSNWWRDWVHDKARVLLLNGRITFVSQPTCYPKDCCLLLWSELQEPGYEVWTWPAELNAAARSDGSTPAAARPG